MRQRDRKVILFTAVAGIMVANFASAATYTFTPTTGTVNWINSTQDNWGTGIGGAYPNVAGDVATVTTNITATTTIRLAAPITIGTLNLGDSDGTHSFSINNASTGGAATPANVLTFESALPGGATSLNILGTGTVGGTISANVALGGTSPLTISRGGAQPLTLSGTVALNNNVLTVAGAGAGAVTLSGDITGGTSSRLRQSGSGQLTVASTVKSFQGTYVVDSNSMVFISGSGINSSAMEANGYWSPVGTEIGGTLVFGNNSGTSTPPGQRISSTAVVLNGGHLDNKGQALSGVAAGQIVSDTVGTVNYNSAYSMVSIGTGGGSTGTTMTATTLNRTLGATASVRAAALGSTQQFLVTNTLPSTTLIGAGGAAGSTTMSIIPWMTGANTNAFSQTPGEFVTYVSGVGLRALATAESDVNLTGTSDRNVNVGGITLAADQTVNSLKFTSGFAANMGTGRVLTITSGGVSFAVTGGGVGGAGNAAAGTLAFGSAEGVVWAVGANSNTIGAVVTGTGGLTKAGTGTLILAGSNTYTGKTHVSAGTLQVGTGSVASVLGDDDVIVHNGALLSILSANIIQDDEQLLLLANGLHNGKVNVASGLIETVGGLSLGNDVMLAGYYGSSAAFSANPGLQSQITVNDLYFSGNGLVQVVPEPASLGLLALGGLMGLRRRR